MHIHGLVDEPVLKYSAAQQLVTHVLKNLDRLALCPATNALQSASAHGGAEESRTQPHAGICINRAVGTLPGGNVNRRGLRTVRQEEV